MHSRVIVSLKEFSTEHCEKHCNVVGCVVLTVLHTLIEYKVKTVWRTVAS